MSRPLVSVLTPTWERPDLLAGAIENVRQQSYRPLEHVVVSDGPDPKAVEIAWAARSGSEDGLHDVPVRFVALGRNWSSFLADSFVAAPTVVAQLVAAGDYQTWLADDERMAPDHIAGLVAALEEQGADFAYGRARLYWNGQRPEDGWEIGGPVPRLGEITNALYRISILRHGLYPFGAGMTSDWACIAAWIAAGAEWAFVDRCTLTHRVDH
jgi:Glycosyl transferase family 2